MLEVYIDGACEPVNPGGTASYGIKVFRHYTNLAGFEVGRWIWESHGIVGSGHKMSNNVAEYSALIKFLEWFDKRVEDEAIIHSDSRLLVNQMNLHWQAHSGLYYSYYERALSLVVLLCKDGRRRMKFEWIPGKQNLADELSVKALEEVGIKRKVR